MKNENFPIISEDVIKAMNARWPERCPELDWPMEQVWHYAGQRSVVRYLNEVFKDQRDNSLRSG